MSIGDLSIERIKSARDSREAQASVNRKTTDLKQELIAFRTRMAETDFQAHTLIKEKRCAPQPSNIYL